MAETSEKSFEPWEEQFFEAVFIDQTKPHGQINSGYFCIGGRSLIGDIAITVDNEYAKRIIDDEHLRSKLLSFLWNGLTQERFATSDVNGRKYNKVRLWSEEEAEVSRTASPRFDEAVKRILQLVVDRDHVSNGRPIGFCWDPNQREEYANVALTCAMTGATNPAKLYRYFDDLSRSGYVNLEKNSGDSHTFQVEVTSKGVRWFEDGCPAEGIIMQNTTIHAENSPVQVVGSGASGVQNTSYSFKTDDLRKVIETYRQHVNELRLDPAIRQHADAQVATIEAQLATSEPNGTVIREVGKSLRTIVETALGTIAGNVASTSATWALLLNLFR